ncbi:hypothetical protein OVA24_14020 [Luteolibacter sp. SL250]|uniref:hypothetical protein n=1 Tax=Luteolibacter sp. SL250 TaxID=2995170 RepID=UPI00226F77B0|nr:hypothetical protein [Luteolibacter sp. SL250]WAC18351.1 hypothetical protein OVA24_14020 [Luteolibacter sp. SL250]
MLSVVRRPFGLTVMALERPLVGEMACYYLGWDIGAWRTKQKDGLWLLDGDGNSLGKAACGLQQSLADERDLDGFLEFCFGKCLGTEVTPRRGDRVVMAVDAPFGFPKDFRSLLGIDGEGGCSERVDAKAIDIGYLYRGTEQFVEKRMGRIPLSPVIHQIGSQTTKVMHFLCRFLFDSSKEKGVWSVISPGEVEVTVIEVYPATCKTRGGETGGEVDCPEILNDFTGIKSVSGNISDDEEDGLICALLARLFDGNRKAFHEPGDDIDPAEGWIWYPRSCDKSGKSSGSGRC